MNYKASILLSIFKRKGGEGITTRIIEEKDNFDAFYNDYFLDEVPFLYVFIGFDDWFILTTNRIISNKQNIYHYVSYSSILKVSIPLLRERSLGVKSVSDFTQIEIELDYAEKFYLTVESGLPYWGVFHVLKFICR